MELLITSMILQVSMMGYIIPGVGGLVVGGLIAYLVTNSVIKKKGNRIITEAEQEAEMIKQRKMLQAKEKFLELKADHEKMIHEKDGKLAERENQIKQKEYAFSQKSEDLQEKRKELDTIRENLSVQLELVERRKEELEKSHRQQVEQLETISGLSAEEAKKELIESLKEEARTDAMSYINEIMDEAKLTANQEPKRWLSKPSSVWQLKMPSKTPSRSFTSIRTR
jgi:ribonuclease Y